MPAPKPRALPTRKRHLKTPSSLPKEFLGTVSKLFGEQFKDKLAGSTFLVYGNLFPEEAVLCISLTHPHSLPAASLHISTDLPKNVGENPEKVTEKLKSMVDVAASWFSQCFQGGEGLETVLGELKEASPSWQEFEWEGSQLFVKLNRDNYTLEGAADEWLKRAGFNQEGDDLLDELEDDSEEDGREN